MEEKKYTEKLARLVFILMITALVATFCWYVRNVLVYIVLAGVMSLIAHPVFTLYRKIAIKGHRMPDWAASMLSLLTVFTLGASLVTTIIPLAHGVVQDLANIDVSNTAKAMSVPLSKFNRWVMSTFPAVGRGFKIESLALTHLKNVFNVNAFSSVVGSVTSLLAGVSVTLFAVIFISFFIIKRPSIVSGAILALVPDRLEEKVRASLDEIAVLVSRYLVGLTIEVVGVSLVNFLGLLIVARMGFKYAIGIAFLTGFLNVIPYLGPLIGGAIGVSLSLIIRYAGEGAIGLDVGFMPFVLVLIGIFIFTQLVDNYLYQPLIYSNSVKVHPLEIFVVFLVAGEIGGMVGMLVAVPAYTVLRVVAKTFWPESKLIKALLLETETQKS